MLRFNYSRQSRDFLQYFDADYILLSKALQNRKMGGYPLIQGTMLLKHLVGSGHSLFKVLRG